MQHPLNSSSQLTALTVEPTELHIKVNSKCQDCSMSSKKYHKATTEEFASNSKKINTYSYWFIGCNNISFFNEKNLKQ